MMTSGILVSKGQPRPTSSGGRIGVGSEGGGNEEKEEKREESVSSLFKVCCYEDVVIVDV